VSKKVQKKNIHIKKWDELADDEKARFTMNGSVQKSDYCCEVTGRFVGAIHEYGSALKNNYWHKNYINELVEKAKKRKTNYYHETDIFLYNCLTFVNYQNFYSLKDKSIAVLGSVEPWYEAICLAYGAAPTTIEYNELYSNHDKINLMTVDEYNKNPIKFDVAISISSFEHDGLGRYGDPIDPDGDLKAMQNVRENILKDNGFLFLSVPIGGDKIVWNAHRIYGPVRWPKLIEGFDIVYSSGFSDAFLSRDMGLSTYQPVVVLKKS